MTISIHMYLLTIGITAAFTIFLIYFFNRIKKENNEKAKIIHVPDSFESLWVEIDKRHRILRQYSTQKKDQLGLKGCIEEYEALLIKYKHKIYELGENLRDEGNKENN